MENEKTILATYAVLQDCLDDEDDFLKVGNLIEEMSKINPEKAFDMWYLIIKRYENYVTHRYVNETFYLMDCNMQYLGNGLGYKNFDTKILTDTYLIKLLFREYCYSCGRYDYTQGVILRLLADEKHDEASQLLGLVYSNGNNVNSWFEVMDGIVNATDDYNLSDASLNIISNYAARITDKKQMAKIMSSMISSGFNFNMEEFDKISKKSEFAVNQPNDVRNESIEEALICLVKSNQNIFESRQRLKGLLADYYPDNKLYPNVIMMAYDEGIAKEIQLSASIDSIRKQRMEMQLVNNYGISREIAENVVRAWCRALEK